MRYTMFAVVVVLLSAAGFFAWMGVVLAARAFGAHPDSQPWFYFLGGGVYGALALALVIRALYTFTRVRSKQ